MTDKEKIRAEIERRIEELKPCNTRENLRAHGAIAGYYQILSFINSMQEEHVSDNLEEAAFDYAESCKYDGGEKLLCVEHFKAGAKWQKEQDQSTIELAEDHAMLAGMEKMKEQMMAKAVEAKVTARWPLHSSPLYYSYEIYVPYAQHLSEGDKVKILIIKQEEE